MDQYRSFCFSSGRNDDHLIREVRMEKWVNVEKGRHNITGCGDGLEVQGEKDGRIRDYSLVSNLYNWMMGVPFCRCGHIFPSRLQAV